MIAPNIPHDIPDYPIRILHLEDSEADHHLACRALTSAGMKFNVRRVDSLSLFCELAQRESYQIILADYRLPGFTAIDAWDIISRNPSPPPFIVLSGTIGESAAVAAIHLGISDFVHKDELQRLPRVIQRAIEVADARAARDRAARELAASEKRLSEFATYLQAAIEKERASIAREIHDDIGGSLAAVRLDLAWISRHTHTEELRAHADAASEMIQHALGASQRIMMSLRPSILDQGLVAAIQWLATGFERRTGIKTTVTFNNDRLSPSKPIELTAYRTAQEALTNVSKYACCTQVAIDISDAENVLTIEIADNGKGIAPECLENAGAFGIRGLTERARLVGGWLDVSTALGSGTSIILSVPLAPEDTTTMEDAAHD